MNATWSFITAIIRRQERVRFAQHIVGSGFRNNILK